MVKKILLLILCLGLIGCSITSKRKHTETQVLELKESLSKKDEGIKKLQILLNEKEEQLEEKDKKIEELRKKLEMFGVFEK